MPRWECPECGREFGNRNQAHVCVPGNTVADAFAGRPPVQREIYEEVAEHLRTLGPLHEDAVGVGVFLLSDRKLAEIRPMARALSVNLVLPRTVDSARVTRTERTAADKVWHIIRLTEVDQVDDELCAWLTEAYDYATD
jgi:uncharacterized protein DUF5655